MRSSLINRTSVALVGSFIAVCTVWMIFPRLGLRAYDPLSLTHNLALLARELVCCPSCGRILTA